MTLGKILNLLDSKSLMGKPGENSFHGKEIQNIISRKNENTSREKGNGYLQRKLNGSTVRGHKISSKFKQGSKLTLTAKHPFRKTKESVFL